MTDRVSQTDRLPRVAVLISAYNEESVIEAKVKNSLELDYPADRLECLIGLDAPTDRTNFILTGMPSSQLRVFPFRMRRGKLAVICDLAQRTFEIMQKEQTLGAGSTFQTMTAQRDLSIAELDMVTAMTTYEKAKIELDRATGSTLEHNGIRVQDAENGTIATQSP